MARVIEVTYEMLISERVNRDCIFVFKSPNAKLVTIGLSGGKCVFENCRFIVDYPVADNTNKDLIEFSGETVIFNRCSFENIHDCEFIVQPIISSKPVDLNLVDVYPEVFFTNCKFDNVQADYITRALTYVKLENCTINNSQFISLIRHAYAINANPVHLQSIKLNQSALVNNKQYASAFIDVPIDYTPAETKHKWYLADIELHNCYISAELILKNYTISNLQYSNCCIGSLVVPKEHSEITFNNTYATEIHQEDS